MNLRRICAALALVLAMSLSACKEAEEETAAGYEPSKLVAVEGKTGDDNKRVVFTKEGAARTDVKTAEVRRSGGNTLVPYEALLYDSDARTFVYTSPKPLNYVRERVKVDRIEGQRVLLSNGPPAGTQVVTVGATEVYGTELEIAGSH